MAFQFYFNHSLLLHLYTLKTKVSIYKSNKQQEIKKYNHAVTLNETSISYYQCKPIAPPPFPQSSVALKATKSQGGRKLQRPLNIWVIYTCGNHAPFIHLSDTAA